MSNPEYNPTSDPVTELIGDPEAGMKLKVKRAQLKVIKGPDKGREEPIPLHGLIVGKGPSCNFVLTDPAVSSEHFRIVPTEKGFYIEDLGSSNGTWLKNASLCNAYIAHKEKLNVGYTTLRLEELGSHEEHPLSVNSSFGEMIGHSVAMRQVFSRLERAAMSDTNLLLEGESGTGKDLAAETVHSFSNRKDKPFIVVDCGSMQSNLVGSILFGHVKGAFTGATTDYIGAFEAAKGGTVFLDEIGELELELQPKLLRVLERKQVQRIGETGYNPVDFRLIAATNRHLDSELKAERFRKDLFYRLSVLRVHIPALRDHCEDISVIASGLIRNMDPIVDPQKILSEDVLTMFANHNWPGNIRELRNVIERLLLFPEWPEQVIETNINEIETSTLGDSGVLPFLSARNLVLERFEKKYISSLLESCGGNVSQASKKSKVSRQTLHRLMRKYVVNDSSS